MKFHNITNCDMLNGDGLRVVLWLSGCEIHCEHCQNQITWDPDYGLDFDETAHNELMSKLSKPYIQGITFTGGHPLHPKNIKDVAKLIELIKKDLPDKNIWLYTGYTFEQILDILDNNNFKYAEALSAGHIDDYNEYLSSLCYIIHNIDIMVDGPYIHKLRDTQLKWRGSSNQRVIDMKKTLNNIKELKDNYKKEEFQECIVLHCD